MHDTHVLVVLLHHQPLKHRLPISGLEVMVGFVLVAWLLGALSYDHDVQVMFVCVCRVRQYAGGRCVQQY